MSRSSPAKFIQPEYHSWINRIERLCKQLHETVMRNPRCKKPETLMTAVRRFMRARQPFPSSPGTGDSGVNGSDFRSLMQSWSPWTVCSRGRVLFEHAGHICPRCFAGRW
jgi:hypothetical protein